MIFALLTFCLHTWSILAANKNVPLPPEVLGERGMFTVQANSTHRKE